MLAICIFCNWAKFTYYVSIQQLKIILKQQNSIYVLII